MAVQVTLESVKPVIEATSTMLYAVLTVPESARLLDKVVIVAPFYVINVGIAERGDT